MITLVIVFPSISDAPSLRLFQHVRNVDVKQKFHPLIKKVASTRPIYRLRSTPAAFGGAVYDAFDAETAVARAIKEFAILANIRGSPIEKREEIDSGRCSQ